MRVLRYLQCVILFAVLSPAMCDVDVVSTKVVQS